MKLSVVIPTRNEEKAIGATLGFLRNELTAFPFELVVADGGSTDRTVAVAKKYATVLEYHGEERKTIAWGKNRGAEAAKGEFLVFIDADVRIPKPNEFFRSALAEFERDPKLAGLTVKLRVFPESATFADRFFFGWVNIVHYVNNNILHTGSASGEFQMMRKTTFDAVRGYKEYLPVAEDNDMFRRIARFGRTRIAWDLTVFHTGRRAHAVGWPRLLWEWFTNDLSVRYSDRSHHKEWRQIR